MNRMTRSIDILWTAAGRIPAFLGVMCLAAFAGRVYAGPFDLPSMPDAVNGFGRLNPPAFVGDAARPAGDTLATLFAGRRAISETEAKSPKETPRTGDNRGSRDATTDVTPMPARDLKDTSESTF